MERRTPERQAMEDNLSVRERQLLGLASRGFTDQGIAHELGISPRTVEVYRANVMSKTHAGGLSELVRIALLAGF